ncbi:MAG: type II 3-dehydroquinate dehydratase [Rubricoccaceae bacterium]|nr:type II 3-dehydroquinate dehydratase [Rubricoccaceae bacterium]
MRVLVLNGPNLDRLGTRETEVYGHASLGEIARDLRAAFPDLDLDVQQHNGEGALLDALHAAERDGVAGVVFNPGAYGHTSLALRDAIAALAVPVVEVHLSNVFAREAFRQTLVLAGVCRGVISGLGADGYALALRYLRDHPGPDA